MKKIYLLPLMLLLLFSACRKDVDDIGTTVTNPGPEIIIENYNPEVKPVTSSVEGQVFDGNRQAIANATVRLGNATTRTDDYGFFSFENISMNEKGTFITVQQAGFLDGSRRFFPRENVESKVIIEMIAEAFRPSFEATAGGTVNISGTTDVAFPANSIVNANGEVFDGEVHVSSAFLDPTASSTANRMPGNLQGVRTDLEEVSLQSFGMINVSLQDPEGAPLNIREGFSATISVALPAEIVANAPAEIPLWSFNETFGIWVEEGSANLVAGHYVGEVSHFSWWNCDAPFPLIELDVTLTDDDGNPVADHIVAIGFGSDSLATHYSYTNSEGFTSGKVPADEELILQIRGICNNEVLYTTFIGPFSENTSLNIQVTTSVVNNTEVTGSLIDCNGAAVTNGGVIVTIDDIDYTTRVDDDGLFNFFFSTCDGTTDLTIKGLDFEAGFESDPLTGMSGTVINTGAITVCDNPITESIMTINVGGEVYEYFGNGLTGGVTPNGVINVQFIPEDSLGQETFISLQINGTTAGNYDDNNNCTLYDFSTDLIYNLGEVDSNSQVINFANFTITELSPNLKGNFSDNLINFNGPNNDPVPVSGSFTIIQ